MATEKNDEAQANPGPKGAYGTIHVTEEQMREAGAGVYEDKSGEAGRRKSKARTAPVKTDKASS